MEQMQSLGSCCLQTVAERAEVVVQRSSRRAKCSRMVVVVGYTNQYLIAGTSHKFSSNYSSLAAEGWK